MERNIDFDIGSILRPVDENGKKIGEEIFYEDICDSPEYEIEPFDEGYCVINGQTYKVVGCRGDGSLILNAPVGFTLKTPIKRTAAAEWGRATKKIVTMATTEEYMQKVPGYEKSVEDAGMIALFKADTSADETSKKLARNIKLMRAYYDISAEELADKAGVTRQYIGQLEAGEKTPSLNVLCSIAAALKTSAALLISVDMPNYFMHYTHVLFSELSKKDPDKQVEILEKAIKYIIRA